MKSCIASLAIVLGFSFVGEALAHEDKPKMVRIHVMNVEMMEVDYTAMMRRGEGKGSDYTMAMGLVAVGKARIQDVNVVSGVSGWEFTVEGIREEIFVTEYDQTDAGPTTVVEEKPSPIEFVELPNRPYMSAFETRNTGVTLEVEPMVDGEGKFVDLRFTPEFVTRRGFSVWMENEDVLGKSDVKFPIYDTHRVNTKLTLESGKFVLSHGFTPKDADAEGELDGERKILVFVMTEIITVKE